MILIASYWFSLDFTERTLISEELYPVPIKVMIDTR